MVSNRTFTIELKSDNISIRHSLDSDDVMGIPMRNACCVTWGFAGFRSPAMQLAVNFLPSAGFNSRGGVRGRRRSRGHRVCSLSASLPTVAGEPTGRNAAYMSVHPPSICEHARAVASVRVCFFTFTHFLPSCPRCELSADAGNCVMRTSTLPFDKRRSVVRTVSDLTLRRMGRRDSYRLVVESL